MTVRTGIAPLAFVALLSVFSTSSPAQSQPAAAVPSTGSEKSAAQIRKEARAADRKLVKRVGTTLARTRNLDSSRILIRARDGVVTLSGTVQDSAQIAVAVDAAQGVDGVQEVRNQLRLNLRGQ